MIKARLKLDSTAIANEIDSRVTEHITEGQEFDFRDERGEKHLLIEPDDLSNIVNAIVKEYMDELDGQNLGLG